MTDTILVVDDDLGIQKQLKWSLTDYNVVFADDYDSAIRQVRRYEPKVVTLDLGLPPDPANASEGLRILQDIVSLAPRTKVIVVTGNNEKENALKAVNFGAYDFYQKPIDSDTIKLLVNRALNLAKLEHENSILSKIRTGMSRIVGNSEAIQTVVKKAEKIAAKAAAKAEKEAAKRSKLPPTKTNWDAKEDTQWQPTAASSISKSVISCQECGAVNNSGTAYCSSCGAFL